jgi:hypothetical protein
VTSCAEECIIYSFLMIEFYLIIRNFFFFGVPRNFPMVKSQRVAEWITTMLAIGGAVVR